MLKEERAAPTATPKERKEPEEKYNGSDAKAQGGVTTSYPELSQDAIKRLYAACNEQLTYDDLDLRGQKNGKEFQGIDCIHCGGAGCCFTDPAKKQITCRKCNRTEDYAGYYRRKWGIKSFDLFKQLVPALFDNEMEAARGQGVQNGFCATSHSQQKTGQDRECSDSAPIDPETAKAIKKNQDIVKRFCVGRERTKGILNLFKLRGIPQEYVEPKIGKTIFWKSKHGNPKNPDDQRDVLVITCSSLPGAEHTSQQYFTADNSYFPGLKTRKKSSPAIGHGFYLDGAPLGASTTDKAFVVESIMNAFSLLPYVDVTTCIIAILSSSEARKKAEMLKPWVEGFKLVVPCGDNDDAGNTMDFTIAKVLKDTVTVRVLDWRTGDPSDINDLQMDRKYDRLRELVENPIPIRIKDDEPEEDENKPAIEFYNMGDLCNQKVSMKFHAINFMEGKAGLMISGAGGLGKSLVSMNIALELAKKQKPIVNGDGMNLLDNTLWGTFPIPKTCTSLFIQSENNLNTTNMRLNKMAGECPDCRDALQRIFMPKIKDDCLMSGLTLDNDEFPKYILDLIHMIEDQTSNKLDILWVDPIISYVACDENHSVDVRRHLDVLTMIASEADVTPAIIHHGKKDDSGFRGTSAFRDWCRSHIELKREWTTEERLVSEPGREEEDSPVKRQASVPLIKVHHEKSNNFREFDDFSLRSRHDLTFAIAESNIPPEEAKAGAILVEILESMTDQIAGDTKALTEPYKELTGASEATAKRHVSKAVENSFLSRNPSPGKNGLLRYTYTLPR